VDECAAGRERSGVEPRHATRLPRRRVPAVAAGVAGIRRGLDVNAELQSAQLGIAALVAAQGGLTDAKGKRLDVADALNAADGIAARQLRCSAARASRRRPRSSSSPRRSSRASGQD
jgi:hypothetical protein